MTKVKGKDKPLPIPVSEAGWGEGPENQYGYVSEQERFDKRGLEDWEMVEHIQETDHRIPYWFIALFVILLIIAVALNFPFWGDRPGYERDWFNWGMPAAVVYCIAASAYIYWLVDYRDILAERKQKKAQAQQSLSEHDAPPAV